MSKQREAGKYIGNKGFTEHADHATVPHVQDHALLVVVEQTRREWPKAVTGSYVRMYVYVCMYVHA